MEIEKLKLAAQPEPQYPSLVSFRVADGVKEQVHAFCVREGVTFGALMRALVNEFINEANKNDRVA